MTGVVRGAPLSQRWKAARALVGKYIEIRVTDGTPLIDGKSYEAVYFIGASDSGFVMNLMDVFGAEYSAIAGIGHREADEIVFEFAYATGPWTWRWSLAGSGWDHEQTYFDQGERKIFATKHMRRVG